MTATMAVDCAERRMRQISPLSLYTPARRFANKRKRWVVGTMGGSREGAQMLPLAFLQMNPHSATGYPHIAEIRAIETNGILLIVG